MKVFAAALPFLILAAVLGALIHGSSSGGVRHPPDCCPSYIPRNMRCAFMEDYYETSRGCPLPAVIFITKRGQQVCVDPHSRSVQRCMEKLDSANTGKTAD